MVGYALLIVFAAVLGVITYSVLKTYVPQQKVECPEGTSLIIENYTCDSNSLSFGLRNNGRFDVGGYFVYATHKPDQIKATLNLYEYNTAEESILHPLRIDAIKLGMKGTSQLTFFNNFSVNEIEVEVYDLTDVDEIYAIEVVPLRWQEEEGKLITVSCADQKVRKSIDCS